MVINMNFMIILSVYLCTTMPKTIKYKIRIWVSVSYIPIVGWTVTHKFILLYLNATITSSAAIAIRILIAPHMCIYHINVFFYIPLPSVQNLYDFAYKQLWSHFCCCEHTYIGNLVSLYYFFSRNTENHL